MKIRIGKTPPGSGNSTNEETAPSSSSSYLGRFHFSRFQPRDQNRTTVPSLLPSFPPCWTDRCLKIGYCSDEVNMEGRTDEGPEPDSGGDDNQPFSMSSGGGGSHHNFGRPQYHDDDRELQPLVGRSVGRTKYLGCCLCRCCCVAGHCRRPTAIEKRAWTDGRTKRRPHVIRSPSRSFSSARFFVRKRRQHRRRRRRRRRQRRRRGV